MDRRLVYRRFKTESEPAVLRETPPRHGTRGASFDAGEPKVKIGRRVLKGGSHLCTANYCQR
jgi:hypothetical protein